MENIHDNTLEKAKNSFIKLLKYRFKHHVDFYASKEVWYIILHDSISKPYDLTCPDTTILCHANNFEEAYCKKNNVEGRFYEDLVLVKLDEETVHYVLADSGKRYKVLNATSTAELECNGTILYISKVRDPPEAISSEIIKRCFGSDMKTCSSNAKGYVEMVRNNDTQKLKEELQDVDSINNATDEMNWTILHYAAYYENWELLSFLISIGQGTPWQDDICGRSPMHIVAREGYDAIGIQLFLDNGTSINKVDNIGWTLLHYAAWNGNSKLVSYLIANMAQVDVKDKCLGKTPFHVGAEEGHLGVVELLISFGSDIEDKTDEGWTALHIAANNGHFDVIEYLVGKEANLEAITKNGWSLLHCAADGGHLKIAQYLVGKGANLNASSGTDSTPLHCAAHNGHLNVVEYLVNDSTPLHCAAHNGHLNVVEYLVNDSTPLHCAAENGHLSVVEYLVGKEANLNALNHEDLTPLNLAAYNGHIDIVDYLMDKGCNLNADVEGGWTPLHSAAHNGQLHMVKYLVEKGADVNAVEEDGWTPIRVAAGNGHFNLVEYLAEEGANLNAGSALHVAAEYGYFNIVEYLVEKGANLNDAVEDGSTPLHFAVRGDSLEVVKFLVERGANMKAVDENGCTPLHWAACK